MAAVFERAASIPNVTSLSVHQDGMLVREAYYGGRPRTPRTTSAR